MDNLQSVFDETLKREGKDIILSDESKIKAFFRRNDKGDVDKYLTMFVSVNQPVVQGNTFTLNNVPYIILKQLTPENNVYNKYICVQLNQHIKYMLKRVDDSSKADLVEFDMFMLDTFADRVSASEYLLVVGSQSEFKLTLNDLSRRIKINDRFFSEFYGAVWKITDINYKDGMASLFCERDVINPSDDAENGIANRWEYEHKPDTYNVTLSESFVTINVGQEEPLTVTLTKNNEPYEPTVPYTWITSDDNIAYVNEQNNVVGVGAGDCTVRVSYKENPNDITNSASCDVYVEEGAEIVINPPYDEDGYYYLIQTDTVTFTATLSGVSSPQWNITLDPQTVPSNYYNSTINNAKGTFTVENLRNYNKDKLKYTITETTSGKSVDYYILLAPLF